MAESDANSAYGREAAWKLLTAWTLSESLRKHALAVDLDAHIGFCIEAMKKRAAELGL